MSTHRPRSFVASLALASLLALPAASQEAAPAVETGIVSGTVADPQGNPLPGVRVRVEGTTLATATDVSGLYRLARVPAGDQTLVFEFLGSGGVREAVSVPAGGAVRRDAVLEPAVYSDEVTVHGEPILEGQAKALNQQKTAVNIQTVVASDQFGRFPDPNAAEAAQRLPGIVIQRDQGEGRYVLVRGTEARLSSVAINGERVPSPEGDVRSVALDVIPADLLAAIEVTKALRPDMDGDAIGGTVNLVTRRAPAGTRLAGTVGAGYNDISDDQLATGNLSYGRRSQDGRTGLVVAGHWHETARGSENVEAAYDDDALEELELRHYSVDRERMGATLDLDRELSGSGRLYLRGIFTEYSDQEFRRAKLSAIGDGEIEREIKDRLETQQIGNVSLGGSQVVGSSTFVDYHVAWGYGEEDEPDAFYTLFKQEDVEFDVGELRAEALNEDPGAYELDEIVREDNLTTEEDWVAALDVSRGFYRDASLSGLFKVGAKVRLKEKDRDNEVFEYDTPGLTLLDVLDTGFDGSSIVEGRYDIGPFHRTDTGRTLVRDLGLEAEKDVEEDLADYRASEDTYAGYGLVEVQLGERTSALGGVRYEHTETDYDAFELVFDDEGDVASVAPTADGGSYGELLPSFHVRRALGRDSNLRFAVTRSLARPDYESLAPFELVLEEDGEIERGNPDLDVTTAWNVDLMYERYFEPLGVLSAGVFYKDLRDNVFFFRSEEIRDGDRFDVTEPRNGEDAQILGLEVAYQQRFRSGFGLLANLTASDSESTLPERPDDLRLPGQADLSGNLGVSYERGRFSGRVLANYHDDWIVEVGGEPAEDVFVDEHLQLDLSAEYRFSDRLRAFLEVVNLNDEPYRVYEGSPDRPIQEEYYSWWGTLGVKLDW